MTRKETADAVNRVMRFLYDGMRPGGLDRKQGRRRYYRISDIFAHYDWRHWHIAIDTRTSMSFGLGTHGQFLTHVKITMLYWSSSSGTATRSVDMALVRCTEEKDYENVLAMFAAMKDKSMAPALAGIPDAVLIMEELLK